MLVISRPRRLFLRMENCAMRVLAPMLDCFQMAPEGREIVQQHRNGVDWWGAYRRPAVHDAHGVV